MGVTSGSEGYTWIQGQYCFEAFQHNVLQRQLHHEYWEWKRVIWWRNWYATTLLFKNDQGHSVYVFFSEWHEFENINLFVTIVLPFELFSKKQRLKRINKILKVYQKCWLEFTRIARVLLAISVNFCFHWNIDNFPFERKTNTLKWETSQILGLTVGLCAKNKFMMGPHHKFISVHIYRKTTLLIIILGNV